MSNVHHKHASEKKTPPVLQKGVHAKELLAQHKLKITKSRIAVLEAISSAKKPVSAQEIGLSIKKGIANPVTIYRILQSLSEKGIIRKINLRHDHIDYELVSESDHHHIICTTCGRIEDFTDCSSEKLIRAAMKQSQHFATIHEHAIELFGKCTSCTSK